MVHVSNWNYKLNYRVWLQVPLLVLGCSLVFAQTKPDVPASVSATDGLYHDKVVVSWSAAAGADYYRVYICGTIQGVAGNCDNFTEVDNTVLEYTPTYSDVLTAFRVAACNEFGCSASSTAALGSRNSSRRPGVPTNVSATQAASTEFIEISWDESDHATVYILSICYLVSDSSLDCSFHQSVRTSTTRHLFANAVPGLQYAFSVRACNIECTQGSGFAWGSLSNPDGLGFPRVPQQVVALNDASLSNIRVSWQPLEGANSYTVLVCLQQAVVTQTCEEHQVTNNYFFFVIPHTDGRRYSVRVRGCRDGACSEYSAADVAYFAELILESLRFTGIGAVRSDGGQYPSYFDIILDSTNGLRNFPRLPYGNIPTSEITTSVRFSPSAAHLGQSVDLYAVFFYSPFGGEQAMYFVNERGGIEVWDGRFTSLKAFRTNTRVDGSTVVELARRTMPAGAYKLHVGYALAGDSRIYYSMMAASFSIAK